MQDINPRNFQTPPQDTRLTWAIVITAIVCLLMGYGVGVYTTECVCPHKNSHSVSIVAE